MLTISSPPPTPRSCLALSVIVMLLSGPAVLCAAASIPEARQGKAVYDQAGVLTSSEVRQLESQVEYFHANPPHLIMAILILPTLEDEPLADVAQRVFDKWKIGRKGTDNGLLILVAMRERKIRIHTGYGTEKVITDGEAGTIIRRVIQPLFKRRRFAQGLLAGMTALAQAAEGEFTAGDVVRYSKATMSRTFHILFVLAILCAALGSAKWYYSAGIGGLGFALTIGLTFGMGILGFILLFLFGSLLGWFVSIFSQASSRSGFGGFYFGGGFSGGSGGGFSSGGFSSFGGGSSGGGGASGGW